MNEDPRIKRKISDIFRNSLNFMPPDEEADLFQEGGLDSLMFVELLSELERVFDIAIPLEKLDLDNFRTLHNIADYVSGFDLDDKEDTSNIFDIRKAAGGRRKV